MPKVTNPIDFDLFNSLFEYVLNSESGLIYKQDVMSGTRPIKAGTRAGCKHKKYWVICVNKRQYKVHRIVWTLHKGSDFDGVIDHINGDGFDNRIENLREASWVTNRQNISTPKNNTSGFIGVAWQEATKRWSASIMINGKRKFLGYFENPEDGFEAYVQAKKELHTFNPELRNWTGIKTKQPENGDAPRRELTT